MYCQCTMVKYEDLSIAINYEDSSFAILFSPKSTSTQITHVQKYESGLGMNRTQIIIQRKKKRRRPNARPVVAELAHQRPHDGPQGPHAYAPS